MSKTEELDKELKDELAAMDAIVKALEPLPVDARYRVLNWARDRYGLSR